MLVNLEQIQGGCLTALVFISQAKKMSFFKLMLGHIFSKDLNHSAETLKWTHNLPTNNVTLKNSAPIPLLSP